MTGKEELVALLVRAVPSIERHWGMTPGGPKKSALLGLLREVRATIARETQPGGAESGDAEEGV
jgi:hypothetical protein